MDKWGGKWDGLELFTSIRNETLLWVNLPVGFNFLKKIRITEKTNKLIDINKVWIKFFTFVKRYKSSKIKFRINNCTRV